MEIRDWRGYEQIVDRFNEREYLLVKPHKAAEGNPWVWRAEFFSAFDSVDMDLLEKGWHIGYYGVSNMYGCDESIELMKKFRDFFVKEYGLSEKADIFGFSRGGLYSVNYTAKYPNDISVLYLDAPVLDVRSWPGGVGIGCGSPNEWEDCKRWFKLSTVNDIVNFKGNPLDKIDTLIENNIPVVLCAGDSDVVVPYVENGEIFSNEYKAKGGDIMTIVKPGCDHHPHSIYNPKPISDFIMEHK